MKSRRPVNSIVMRFLNSSVKILAKEWAIGIATLVALFFGIFWFGEAFRAHTLFFVFFWIGTPICASFLHRKSVAACFTLNGMNWVRGVLVAVAVAISFAMFANEDHIRNRVGRHYVEGYRYWLAEPETDDDGRQYYPGDHWTAKNSTGTWALTLFGLSIFVTVFAMPAATWKISDSAIQKKRENSIQTFDGKIIETYESHP